jgi:hypothetical protein
VERLAIALCWQASTEREFLRTRARFIIDTLRQVMP